MADHYWVGGTASITGSGVKWATTSGGSATLGDPSTGDNAFFDANSGAVTVTLAVGSGNHFTCLNLNFTGFTGTFAGGTDGSDVRIYGNLTLGSGMTFTNIGQFQMWATSGTKTITSNGKTMTCGLNVGTAGTGATFQLQDDLTLSSTRQFAVDTAIFDTNNKNMTVGSIACGGSGTRTLTFGSSTITILGTGCQLSGTNLTITANTANIHCTNASNSDFDFTYGAYTYPDLWFDRGASTGLIKVNQDSGSPTFNGFKDTGTVAHSLLFRLGVTHTFLDATKVILVGNSGQLIKISSYDNNTGGEATSTHTLSCASGTINANYVSIQHSVATGGATWKGGSNSTNNQAVATAGSGWSFASAPTVTTQAVSAITPTTATGNGNVTSDGGDTVTERGVVVGTSSNPTTSDTKFTTSGTTGAFTASITGRANNTLYHVRAYAINSIGTSYGSDVSFTTTIASTLTATVQTYTLTLVNALMHVALKLSATVQTYVLTLVDAILNKNIFYTMTATVQTYTLTLVSAILNKSVKMIATVRTYSLTLVGALFSHGQTLIATTQTYTVTFVSALFHKAVKMLATVRTHSLVGVAIRLLFNGYAIKYTNTTKNNATFSNNTKHSSTWLNQSKS